MALIYTKIDRMCNDVAHDIEFLFWYMPERENRLYIRTLTKVAQIYRYDSLGQVTHLAVLCWPATCSTVEYGNVSDTSYKAQSHMGVTVDWMDGGWGDGADARGGRSAIWQQEFRIRLG